MDFTINLGGLIGALLAAGAMFYFFLEHGFKVRHMVIVAGIGAVVGNLAWSFIFDRFNRN